MCTAGTNGRCVPVGPLPGCNCTYDACHHDTDCGAGKACACHGIAETGFQGNTCLPGNCRTDTDCGPGGYCSPAYDPMSCSTIGGYYCHTPSDQCIDDQDCPPSMMPARNLCTYSTTAGRWQCTPIPLCV
jgi:hypothetical protein